MTKDIPTLAYIEQQVLGRAARSGSLGAAARDVEADYGMAAGSLGVGLVRDVYRARMVFEAIEAFLETVGALMANERNRTVH